MDLLTSSHRAVEFCAQKKQLSAVAKRNLVLVGSLIIVANMASDQIRQMVNFILQEAHEKANEIRVKVRACYR